MIKKIKTTLVLFINPLGVVFKLLIVCVFLLLAGALQAQSQSQNQNQSLSQDGKLYSEQLNSQQIISLDQWLFVSDKSLNKSSLTQDDIKQSLLHNNANSQIDWQPVKAATLLPQKYNASVCGWYKTQWQLELPINADLALLIESLRGADQVWLNDQWLGGTGALHSPWQVAVTQPQSLPRLYHLPRHLLQQGSNTLLIKINTGIGHSWGAMYPGGTGITGRVLLADKQVLEQSYFAKSYQIVALDMVFIILGLVDVLIILILLKKTIRPFPEFKWLLLGSCLMMLGAGSHDVFFLSGWSILPGNMALFLSLLFIPFVNALYFWSQNNDLPVRLWWAVSSVFLMIVFLILMPFVDHSIKNIVWQGWAIFAALFFAYALFSAIKAVKRGRIGGLAQLIGLVVYIFSIRSQWIPFDSFDHRNIQIGSLFFRYAILLAYFQQIFYMRVSYKALSKKVLSVSERTRQGIARELHDSIGQYLASAKLQLNLAKKTQQERHYNLLQGELDDALAGMRRTIAGLHSFSLENEGLRQTMADYCDSLENKHNTKVLFDMTLDNRFNQPLHDKQELDFQQNIFRVIQELANNSIQHGQATQLRINFHCQGHSLMIAVCDNGIGFDFNKKKLHQAGEKHHGFGFISLRERVAILDGQMQVTSHLSRGTHTNIRVPY